MAAERLSLDEVIARFEAVKSDQIATIYRRRNPAARAVGVRFGDIDKLAKQIKRDTALGMKLWETGTIEGRELACRIVDPAELTEATIDRWVAEIDFPTVADSFAGLVYRTPYAREKMEQWTANDREFVRRSGFSLVYQFAADTASEIDDRLLIGYLEQIEREIHASANWAREMMNLVPIAIGKRNPALFEPALATAAAYGKAAVFHGDKTNCKVWNAVEALQDPRVHARKP